MYIYTSTYGVFKSKYKVKDAIFIFVILALLIACLVSLLLAILLFKQRGLTEEAVDEASQWRRKQMNSSSKAKDLQGQLDSANRANSQLQSGFSMSRASMYRAVRHQTLLRRELGGIRRRVINAETNLATTERKFVDLIVEPVYAAPELAPVTEVDSLQEPDVETENFDGPTERSESLWRLECLRSERLWRTNVSVNPMSDESPFDDSENLARLCVEVEAASLREEVGADTVIDWQLEPISDPAQAHLLVKVAGEMLSVAAKTPSVRKTLLVTADPEVSVHLIKESAVDIDLTRDDLGADLIASAEAEGLELGVEA